MNQCLHCKRTLGFNEPYYVVRTKDTRFMGRKRYQRVAACCEDCEEQGQRTQYTIDEWRDLRDGHQGEKP